MIITSAGIYGYLSAAYAKVAADPLRKTADIQTADTKVISLEQDITRKNDRLNQLIGLRAQQENRLDGLINKSQSGNSSMIRSAQSTLTAADKSVKDLQIEISTLSSIRDSLNTIKITKQVEIETNGDIGTFVYIAKAFNLSLDTVVKWFTLIIVVVFDPLAVALVIAINFLLKKDGIVNNTPIIETVEEPYSVYVPDPIMEVVTPVVEEPPTGPVWSHGRHSG
jgi:hypothetical protein